MLSPINMNPLLAAVAEGWSWKLDRPVEILATNLFGNVIVQNDGGEFFRIMPEEWSCEWLANSLDEFEAKVGSETFVHDWAMTQLVAMADAAHGPLGDGQVYGLVTPGILGGKYTAENLQKVSLKELLVFSGEMAQQIDGLPEGAPIQIVVQRKAED